MLVVKARYARRADQLVALRAKQLLWLAGVLADGTSFLLLLKVPENGEISLDVATLNLSSADAAFLHFLHAHAADHMAATEAFRDPESGGEGLETDCALQACWVVGHGTGGDERDENGAVHLIPFLSWWTFMLGANYLKENLDRYEMMY